MNLVSPFALVVFFLAKKMPSTPVDHICGNGLKIKTKGWKEIYGEIKQRLYTAPYIYAAASSYIGASC